MKFRNFVFATACMLAMVSCQRTTKVEHIVFIGLDGMSSASFEKADMPFVKSLLPESSYTVKKRSVLPSSSAINWMTMFSGAGPELHGYTTWGSKTPELPSRVILKNGIFPTVFQLFRDKYADAQMGCFYDWDGIKYLVDTLSFSTYSQPPKEDFVYVKSLTETSCKYIAENNPDLTVIIFDNPDHEGHTFGWCSPEYMDVLTKLDKGIETIFKTCQEAGFTRDNTVFIITADHGGIEKGHGNKTMDEMETPFIILGKNIRKGYCFDDISMMQYDIASTIARMYQLEQPQVWVGRPMPVFEN